MLLFQVLLATTVSVPVATCVCIVTDVNVIVSGFAGYDCECPPGYLGRYCETDINECDSSPCPANYTCINGGGHYECECHTDWPCYVAPSTVQPVALSSESTLQPWHIAVITIAACLLLVIITAAVFALKKR